MWSISPAFAAIIRRIVCVLKEFGNDIFMKLFGFRFFNLVKEVGNVLLESLYLGPVWFDFQVSFIN
jgi:hypothetical protein